LLVASARSFSSLGRLRVGSLLGSIVCRNIRATHMQAQRTDMYHPCMRMRDNA
jgi:hypothetical protein